jgi:hypothetical protein
MQWLLTLFGRKGYPIIFFDGEKCDTATENPYYWEKRPGIKKV